MIYDILNFMDHAGSFLFGVTRKYLENYHGIKIITIQMKCYNIF